jgi:hypothetical protein
VSLWQQTWDGTTLIVRNSSLELILNHSLHLPPSQPAYLSYILKLILPSPSWSPSRRFPKSFFLSFLGSTAQLRPWPPPQKPAEFLGGFSTIFFYRVGLLAPRPTPIPEDQASVFISPRGRVATHFSRPLRHAWITVGLFLFHGHHTGNFQEVSPTKFCTHF